MADTDQPSTATGCGCHVLQAITDLPVTFSFKSDGARGTVTLPSNVAVSPPPMPHPVSVLPDRF
jgi:hypothetical protein